MKSSYSDSPSSGKQSGRGHSYLRVSGLALALLVMLVSVGLRVQHGQGSGATFIVTKTADTNGTCNSGVSCSLREAINAANDEVNYPGTDYIVFASNLTGTISLTSALPAITSDIQIIGPGANLLEVTRGSSTKFRIFSIYSSAAPGPSVSISGLSITNGYAAGTLQDANGFGGAIVNEGRLTLTNCILSGNNSDRDGGAIHSAIYFGTSLTVSGCTFSNNTAGNNGGNEINGGGAIYTAASQTVVTNSTFVNNQEVSPTDSGTPTGVGGAIANFDGNMVLTNCTLKGNRATHGGGIYNEGVNNSVSSLSVSNSTLSGNVATIGGGVSGGGIYNNGVSGGNAFVNLKNTILQKGTFGPNLTNNGLGTSITSQGYNLSDDNGGGFLNVSGDQINTNPQLGPLQDNGGPTQTMALLPGSPAWDKGKSSIGSKDQRGSARSVDFPGITNANGGDASDIGAVEMQTLPTFFVTTTADHDDGTCNASDCTLREAIHIANSASGIIAFNNNVNGTITLQTALGSLIVSNSIWIAGPGASALAVSGNANLTVFVFNGGATDTVSGLTIRDGFPPSSSAASGIINGGGALVLSGLVTFDDCAFVNNRLLANSGFTPGAAGDSAQGGAISNFGVLTVNSCTFRDNEAIGGNGSPNTGLPHFGGNAGSGLGGAIYNNEGAALTVNNCTFFNNSAIGGHGGNNADFGGGNGGAGLGGALFNGFGTITLTASTLSGNTGTGGNGGTGRSVLDNGTAGKGSGGIATLNSPTNTVSNSIIAGNTGNHGGGVDADGAFTSGGYNLIGIGNGNSGFTVNGDQVGTTASPINAKLGVLQYNGGQTQTMELLAGSPAIDKGLSNGLSTDQRGLPRTSNDLSIPNAADGTDIGAFEVQVSPPTPTPTPTPTPPNVVQFSSSGYNVQEDCTTLIITVNRIGDTSGTASVDYSSSDVTATERRDYIKAIGTLRFAAGETSKSFGVLINEDSYVEGSETFNITLSNPSGVALGSPSITSVQIIDDASEPATNPLDDPQTFVCQHYHDFLNRQPDPSGWTFWTNEIASCGSDQQCIDIKRINVSAAFFLSIEFQQTGYLVERVYKASYGDATGTSTYPGAHQLSVPVVRLNEFLSDTQEIGQGVVVGQNGWEQQLENNKQAFVPEFVARSRFTTAFPANMTAAQFVDTLNANAGNPLSVADRSQLVSDLSSNAKSRAQVLRAITENQNLSNAEFNRAFVLMQYFGYLRRNPNDPQDSDYTGYDFWLTKLNQSNGNYIDAEMVKAFITSIEYRQRFGP